MAETARLRVPLLAASQAQKHVTVNEALLLVDTLLQAAVLGFADAPAGGEVDGDCYIVGSGSGVFTGWDGRIARKQDGAWFSFLPGAGGGEGWIVWNRDDGQPYVCDGAGGWEPLFAVQDAMVFRGVINCSSNPDYPAADRGATYRVSVAGKIGGGSGINVEAGDLLLCLTDGTASGNQAAVGASWSIAQANLDGAVIGPASVTDGVPALFDGTTGKLLKATTFAAFKTALDIDDLEVMAQARVMSMALTTPPGSPSDGDAYIPAPGASGSWASWDLSIAYASGGSWVKITPKQGWLVFNVADETYYAFDGAAWLPFYGVRIVTRTFSITRPNNTTAYAAGDAWTDSTSAPTTFEIADAARIDGGGGVSADVMVIDSANQTPKLQGTLFLFDTAPTAPNDNAAWVPSDAEMETLVAAIPFRSMEAANGAAGASGNAFDRADGLNFGFAATASSRKLYPVVRVDNAYTPVAQEKLTFRLKFLQVT